MKSCGARSSENPPRGHVKAKVPRIVAHRGRTSVRLGSPGTGLRHSRYNAAMISVSDGQARILAQVISVAPPELIPVGRCLGRVTAEDIRSSMDVPPTDNSAVDGYAIGSGDIPAGGTRELDVV